MDREPYAARFRDQASNGGSTEVLGEDGPSPRALPRWLTRTGAVLALAAVVGIAVRSADDPTPQPPAAAATDEPERLGSAVTIVRNTPPPQAPVELTTATAQQWPTRGYSYVLELSNPTDVPYEIVDIGHPVQGVEMLWDKSLVIAGDEVTTLTVDFLVVNCAAVVGRATPEELRVTLRPVGAAPGAAGTVVVMDLDLADVSADLAAAGGVRCESDRAVILSAG